jgi:integrase
VYFYLCVAVMKRHREASSCFPHASQGHLFMQINAKTITRLALPEGKADVIHFDDALPGFGLRLRKSGGHLRRSWIVQYRRAGATRRLLLGSAEVLGAEQARAAAKKVLAEVALGGDPQAAKQTRRERDTHSLKALIDDYLAWKETSGVRARTFTEVRRYLVGPYFRALHSMPVDRITRRDVAARVLAIARESGTVTASRARTALQAMFTWSMQNGLAESNPLVGTVAPKEAKPRERVLDDAELAAVWRAAGDDDFGRIVRLLIVTGQRRTEVGGICWSEIDTERGEWRIPATRTKNAREHALPLSALAMSVIESVPQRVGRDHLFGDWGPSGFTSWAWAKRYLDKRLGDQVRPWTLHDLRRSTATRMCDIGVAPHVVEELLNHHSGHRGGIAGVYNRSRYEREVKAAVSLWADHVRTLIEGDARKVLAFAGAVL